MARMTSDTQRLGDDSMGTGGSHVGQRDDAGDLMYNTLPELETCAYSYVSIACFGPGKHVFSKEDTGGIPAGTQDKFPDYRGV